MASFCFCTRRPESRAASSLPPIAYMDLPMYVRPSTKAAMSPMTIMTRTGTGSQPPSVSPRCETEAGKAIGEPCEITRARPRPTDSMASVAMNGGSLP